MSDPSSGSPAPRIAIKFGAPSSSASKSATGAKKPNPPSSLGKRPRPHALNQDSDSEEENELHGKHEAVTAFGANGAENESRRRDAKNPRTASKPFVISCQPNRDWKTETKAQQGRELLPHERERQFKGQDMETEPADQDKKIEWGLTVTKKCDTEEPTDDSEEKPSSRIEDSVEKGSEAPGQQHGSRSVDQDAMDALLGKDNGTKLVISETDALKRDYDKVGEISTIEEYEQIPDGEFGLAMLRGMGYNGTDQGTKPKEVRRRSALLGLGAKEDEEIKKAELAKKYGHRERRPRLDEYRREKEKERKQRDRHLGSYKNERDRDRTSASHSRRHDGRDRDRDRNRDSDRYNDRDRDSRRHYDRHSRR
jgi:hypothetical protein